MLILFSLFLLVLHITCHRSIYIYILDNAIYTLLYTIKPNTIYLKDLSFCDNPIYIIVLIPTAKSPFQFSMHVCGNIYARVVLSLWQYLAHLNLLHFKNWGSLKCMDRNWKGFLLGRLRLLYRMFVVMSSRYIIILEVFLQILTIYFQ